MSRVADAGRRLLASPRVYLGLQRALGADRLRTECIRMLDVQPGERVLDVGCGPAYYLDQLPGDVDYVGFDTDCGYIEAARRRWGARGTFRCEQLTAEVAQGLGAFDAVLLMGVLHHMADDYSDRLLGVLAAALTDGGRVISLDTTYHDGQGRMSRWMADNDRGEHVRHPAQWTALAGRHFRSVQSTLLDDTTRVPGSYWVMVMRDPVTGAAT